VTCQTFIWLGRERLTNEDLYKRGSANYEFSDFRTKRETKFSIGLISDTFRLFCLHLTLRIHHVSYGKKLRGNHCKIKNKGKIELGNHVFLHSYPDGVSCRTALLAHSNSSLIKIGDNCVLNGTTIHSRKAVIIGNDCMFGPGVIVVDNDSHNTSTDPTVRRFGKIAEEPVIIGSNVWVGMHSIILKGVHIGDNSIIAAGSVVSKSIPDNQLFGGNPAVFIKKL
jgi:acetyltransferase-like isoleucine patch superfamily enzyme